MNTSKIEQLKNQISLSKGSIKPQLVLKNANIVNVFTNEIINSSIAINDGYICGISNDYIGETEIDLQFKYVAPGLIDSHVHIESTMVTPIQFSNAVLPCGTTTVIADPHEIGNVLGVKGIKFMIELSKEVPLDIFFMVPSCVPATQFETSGSAITNSEIKDLLTEPKILGLGEMMNYPGVINSSHEVLSKILSAHNKNIDGHAPNLTGLDLNAYVCAGIRTEHECTTITEMQEKLRAGLYVQIREGSAAKNLSTLIKGISKENSHRCLFCTDDRHLDDIYTQGHIDYCVRKSISYGINPIDAIKMATLNPSICYNLHKKGAIAPGYIADLIVFDNFSSFSIEQVYKSGKLVSKNKNLLSDVELPKKNLPEVLNTVHCPKLKLQDFNLKINKPESYPCISIIPNELITKKVHHSIVLDSKGFFQYQEDHLLKLALIERHKNTGNLSLALVENFGAIQGAIATTIGHDSHNIIVIGSNDSDMLLAANQLIHQQGGFTITQNNSILGSLPLPIGGLMSDKSAPELNIKLAHILKIAKKIGVNPKIDPFITLSFLALPVIPEIRLTDKGLFDVSSFTFFNL